MIDVAAFRTRARELCEWAVDGANGVAQGSERYGLVTEGRMLKPGVSSSCAELPHWLWYRLGIRSSFVNRDENRGWHVGLGIAMLCGENFSGKPLGVPTTARRTPETTSQFGAGDVLVVWSRLDGTDAHTFVVLEQDGPIVQSADYGQPGGKACTWTLSSRNAVEPGGRMRMAPFRGSRRIQRWIPLDLILAEAERRGELVTPEAPCPTTT